MRFGKAARDICNTNLFEHGGKIYAITENHSPYEIDPSTLNTLNEWSVNGAWDRPFTSHPKVVCIYIYIFLINGDKLCVRGMCGLFNYITCSYLVAVRSQNYNLIHAQET